MLQDADLVKVGRTAKSHIDEALKLHRVGGEGLFGPAIDELAKALELDPHNAEANFYMGKFVYESANAFKALGGEADEAGFRIKSEMTYCESCQRMIPLTHL
jgi:hypothetical protein